MTGIILAGGKNSRMGMKKAFIEIGEKKIIDNALNIFKDIFFEVIIVTNSPEDFYYTKVKLVKDIIPDKGSLGGLYTGIKKAKYNECFVIACDMPFISKALIKYIMSIKGYDAVVPRIYGRVEPLFASYSKKCLGTIENNLSSGNLKISDILLNIKVHEMDENEIKVFDPKLLSLININTPSELNSILTELMPTEQG